MRHFPIFIDLAGRSVFVAGGGETALAKLRLLLKTRADITVYAPEPCPEISAWAAEGRLRLARRDPGPDDIRENAPALIYAAHDAGGRDAEIAALGRQAGVLVNVVDNLEASDFITPALVDRDPVTVAIGTEGAAPVLARKIKADIEAMLPASLGPMARIARRVRDHAAALPMGRARRDFWSRFFFGPGARAFEQRGVAGAEAALGALLAAPETEPEGRVAIAGAGPGDPGLLTRRTAALLHEADVVIHDRLVSDEILDLARREARIIAAGKTGYGPGWAQEDITAEMIRHARAGRFVVRLKGGDPAVFARLDEEVSALHAAGVPVEVVPGITTASAAVAHLGQSLTQRGRNGAFRLVTGHDINGFAEQDWRALAQPGAVSAVYMGRRAARFLAGRLLMHGAAPDLPVTLMTNVSRSTQQVTETVLSRIGDAVAGLEDGPAIILLGITGGVQVDAGQTLQEAQS